MQSTFILLMCFRGFTGPDHLFLGNMLCTITFLPIKVTFCPIPKPTAPKTLKKN